MLKKRVFIFSEISILFFGWLCIFLYNANFSINIKISFFCLVGFTLLSFFLHIINGGRSLTLAVVNIFYYCFYLVAPIIQLDLNDKNLINTMPVNESYVLHLNFLLCIFIFSQSMTYYIVTCKSKIQISDLIIPSNNDINNINKNKLLTLFLFTCVGLIFSYTFIQTQIFNKMIAVLMDEKLEMSSIYGLISAKFFGVIPLLGAVLSLLFYKKNKKWFVLCVIFLIILLIFKNPIMERRNALGTIYLTFLVFLFPLFLVSIRRIYYSLIMLLVIAFPMLSVFTHYKLPQLIEKGVFNTITFEITNHFSQLHYDAWANGIAIIDFVNDKGLQMGAQVSAAFVFFVPRSFWANKPNSTGTEIGDFLMDKYSLWFNNISATFPMEGYIDFGVIGVVLFAIIFSLFTLFVEKKAFHNLGWKVFYVYFSFFCFFVFRGAFAIATAYLIGSFIAIVIMHNFILPLKLNLNRSKKYYGS
tara:strand:- start:6800 stop:8215 length:1416 start_codon:yes stop_codon:yes gene_type:complete